MPCLSQTETNKMCYGGEAMREISMNLQGRIRNLPGSPTRVSVHTQTHKHTHTILQIQVCHTKIAPSAHTVCDPAAVPNPVLTLVFFVPLFFAAGPIPLNFYGMNSLTWIPAGIRGSPRSPGAVSEPRSYPTLTLGHRAHSSQILLSSQRNRE